jgi:hypothetical protein
MIKEGQILSLQRTRDGVAQEIRTPFRGGRYEIVTAGPNPEFGFIGSDPYGTNAGTGLVVPAAPSASIGGARYLMLLARASFNASEAGVRLVGIRQYVELIARVPVGSSGQDTIYRREIKQPLWHPPDGDISWHVMVLNKVQRDSRNPANADGFIYEDSLSPALLYQTTGPYVPPNGGRPWGTPLAASLGNMHDLRYRSRTDQSERLLDIIVPAGCDIGLFVSVRQNDPSTNPSSEGLSANQFSSLTQEDQFLTSMTAADVSVQYGVIYGALAFDENLEYGTVRDHNFRGKSPEGVFAGGAVPGPEPVSESEQVSAPTSASKRTAA